jgi:hypothetical protein
VKKIIAASNVIATPTSLASADLAAIEGGFFDKTNESIIGRTSQEIYRTRSGNTDMRNHGNDESVDILIDNSANVGAGYPPPSKGKGQPESEQQPY